MLDERQEEFRVKDEGAEGGVKADEGSSDPDLDFRHK